eukprot:5011684-Heterocapsa_arctica.AAC.1
MWTPRGGPPCGLNFSRGSGDRSIPERIPAIQRSSPQNHPPPPALVQVPPPAVDPDLLPPLVWGH